MSLVGCLQKFRPLVLSFLQSREKCYWRYALLRSHFNMDYSTDKMLPVESTPPGQSNLVSVEYTCIPYRQGKLTNLFPVSVVPKINMLRQYNMENMETCKKFGFGLKTFKSLLLQNYSKNFFDIAHK